MRYQAPRGTEDILPTQVHRWQHLESAFRNVTESFGYKEIRTPIFEDTDLFLRTSGETSDIVSKEMYSFVDKGGRNISLRPEGTAPVMRSVIEHGQCPPGTVLRLWYFVSFFRYGRPGRGRMRQAHQAGIEIIGGSGALADAEAIEIACLVCQKAGLTDFEVAINSIGRTECRAKYGEAILKHVSAWLKDQPSESVEKIEKNPLGLLDTKDAAGQQALIGVPSIQDFLEPESKARFERLCELLEAAGVPYRIDPMVVRGLDYYTETVFEGMTPHLPGLSIFGGGRYDELIRQIGGSSTPSVGFGMGMERMLLALEGAGAAITTSKPDAFVVSATTDAVDAVLALARQLRSKGLSAVVDPDARSLKSQLRQADKIEAKFALIIGSDELANGEVQVRELATSSQRTVALGSVLEAIADAELTMSTS